MLITGGFFLVPFTVLMERLFHGGYTAQFAAALAILSAAILLLFTSRGIAGRPQIVERFSTAIETSGRQIALIASIILCASLIVGVLGQTGLGVKITSLIVDLSGGWLPAALLLTALACLILGMEVPTTAAYVICISVAGPALQQLGVPLLAAHLFVFLVCAAVDYHAARVRDGFHCCRHDRSAVAAGCRTCHGAGCRALPDPACHDCRHCAYRTGARPDAGTAGVCQGSALRCT